MLKVYREFYYLSHYLEWLELAVARNTSVLKCARLFNAMMASMYTYDRNSDIVRAFCEAWCPSTNTLHISSGEMSISLWDLWVIGGLLIKGRFYEENIPYYQDLLGSPDTCPKSCEHLFTAYYHIASQRMDHSQIPVSEWIYF